MGYVGNQQSEGFSQVPAKQDLTGTAGTSLTLTHAVASAEGIDLYINNVRQEPTTAYSVVGTAVTLTGSVVATDDIYVVYNSLALQTTVPPDASVSTAKIIDGDVTSAKLDTNIAITGDLTVDTSTLKVDSTNNRVGIGTTSPVSLLTVDKGNVTGAGQWASSAIAIANPTNIGAYSQISFGYTPASNASAYIGYVSTNQGANGYGDLVFGTRSVNTNTQPSERMRIDSSGNVLVGTASASTPFDGCRIAIDANSSDGIRVRSGGVPMRFIATGTSTFVGSISTTASTTSYNTSSDYRLKTDVTYDWDATSRLKQLKPARFEWIVDGDDAVPVDGFLAHEVQSIVPEAITGTKDAVDDDGNPVYQGIDQSKLVPLLVKTIQELEARIAALEAS